MTVFVMMPYKDSFRETYRNAIVPAAKDHGLECVLAESHVQPGPIDKQIIQGIENSRFCIADLTEANPNVMYEVAIAHSSRKPVILLTRGDMVDIPFDIRHHRVLRYDPGDDGHRDLAARLRETMQAILASEESAVQLLRKVLVPSTIDPSTAQFAVVANPLSYRAAFRTRGGWKNRVTTFSDHVGIRGLMQAFGLIYGLERLPELLNPDDFDDEVLEMAETRMNLYTIGSPKANRWTGILMNRFFEKRGPTWEFKPDPESSEILNPRVIVRRNNEKYMPSIAGDADILKWDFGLVIRGPHPMDASHMFMVLAGRSSLGTEATCLAVTDPACLNRFDQRLKFDGIDLDDHRQAFCAVVSVVSCGLRTDKGQFRVQEVVRY